MKRRTILAGVAGTSSLLVVAALVSPVMTNAATPTRQAATTSGVSAALPAPARLVTTPRRLTSMQARSLVRAQAHGGRVTDVRGLRHGGFDAFAVRITRADGSTLTGFVDRDSGVVFDWRQTAAPRASQTVTPSTTGDDDAESADDNGSDDQGEDNDSDSVNESHGDSDDDQGDVSDEQGDDQGQQGDDADEHDD